MNDYQRQDIDRLRKDQLDFIFEVACKYGMTNAEVMRLCCYMHIDYAHVKKHTLEQTNVH